jgi:hypothetical protein
MFTLRRDIQYWLLTKVAPVAELASTSLRLTIQMQLSLL